MIMFSKGVNFRMKDKIWLRCPGSVVGVSISWLNSRIDQFNREKLFKYGTFWEWLSYTEGELYYGISFHTEETSEIHKIKECRK